MSSTQSMNRSQFRDSPPNSGVGARLWKWSLLKADAVGLEPRGATWPGSMLYQLPSLSSRLSVSASKFKVSSWGSSPSPANLLLLA